MNWRKDPVHTAHYFGAYTVTKLNNRKRTMVSWLVERGGVPVHNETYLRDAKAWVEADAARAKLTPVSVEEAGRLLASVS